MLQIHPIKAPVCLTERTHCSKVELEVFRFMNPKYSKSEDLFSGRGAMFVSGRWLMKGQGLCVYTSLTPQLALEESLASAKYYSFLISQAMPLVLVSAQVKLNFCLDLRNAQICSDLGISLAGVLKEDWRTKNQDGQEVLSQAWGRLIKAAKVEAIIVPSATDVEGANLIVFPENLVYYSHLEVIKEVDWE